MLAGILMKTVEKGRHLAKQVLPDEAELSVRCVFLRARAGLNENPGQYRAACVKKEHIRDGHPGIFIKGIAKNQEVLYTIVMN